MVHPRTRRFIELDVVEVTVHQDVDAVRAGIETGVILSLYDGRLAFSYMYACVTYIRGFHNNNAQYMLCNVGIWVE
jgi:hypothetical protein